MQEKAWFVYIVECADGTLYTGVSNDLERRIQQHNTGKGAKYTRGRRPVRLVYSKKMSSKGTALKEEARLKKLSRKEKALIFTLPQL